MGQLNKMIKHHLHISKKRLKLYLEKKDSFYKKAFIPKRSGGMRKMYMPNAEIKLLQNLVLEKYLSKVKISKHATAYKKESSIKENAAPHVKNNHFLILDIENFFDNINVNIVRTKIKEFLYLSDCDLDNMIRIMTYKDSFVQGAVTSPAISNIYMHEFDVKMSRLVLNLKNGVYTRYSDDITISSSEHINENILEKIKAYLKELNLTINNNKTYFSSYKDEVEITGLKINQNKISLSRKKKRQLNNLIYYKLKYKEKAKETANQVLGSLYFVMDVDIDYFNFLNYKYKNNNNDLIARLKKIQVKEDSKNKKVILLKERV